MQISKEKYIISTCKCKLSENVEINILNNTRNIS